MAVEIINSYAKRSFLEHVSLATSVDQEWDGDSILELLNRKPADISAKLESQCDSDGPYSVNRSNNQNSTLNRYSDAAPVNYMDSASILRSADPLLGQQPHANATYSPTGPVDVSKLQSEGRTLTVIETYNEGSLCTSQEIDKMVRMISCWR